MKIVYVVTVHRIDRIKQKTGLFTSKILEHKTLLHGTVCFTYDEAVKRMYELSKREYDGFQRPFCYGIDAKTEFYHMFTAKEHKNSTTYQIQIHKILEPNELQRGTL